MISSWFLFSSPESIFLLKPKCFAVEEVFNKVGGKWVARWKLVWSAPGNVY